MVNARSGRLKTAKASRIDGRFLAIPFSVIDSPAYIRLGDPARSLLWDIARQYVGTNNGALLASAKYLKKYGWTSNDKITRAKRELLEAGFIYETFMGHRPNKASWFALTWRPLDRIDGYDAGAIDGFKRWAFLANPAAPNASLRPAGGVRKTATTPSAGVGEPLATPSGGAVSGIFMGAATPRAGDHLEKPSVRAVLTADAQPTLQP